MSVHLCIELTSSAIAARISPQKGVERRMYFTTAVTPETFIDTTVTTLDTVLFEYMRVYGKSVGAIDTCTVAYGAPWHASHITTFKETYQKVTPVSAETLKQIARDHADQQQMRLQRESGGASMRCIDDRTLSVILNDYPATTEVNARVKSIVVTHLTSFASDEDVRRIERTLRRHIQAKHIVHKPLIATMYADATSPSDAYADTTVLALSGEITELCLIQNDIISSIFQSPAGTHTLYRAVEKATGIAYPRSTITTRDAIVGALDTESALAATQGITDGIARWAQEVQTTLAAQKLQRLPAILFVYAPQTERALARYVLTHPSTVAAVFAGTIPQITFIDLCTGSVLANERSAIE